MGKFLFQIHKLRNSIEDLFNKSHSTPYESLLHKRDLLRYMNWGVRPSSFCCTLSEMWPRVSWLRRTSEDFSHNPTWFAFSVQRDSTINSPTSYHHPGRAPEHLTLQQWKAVPLNELVLEVSIKVVVANRTTSLRHTTWMMEAGYLLAYISS